MAFRQRTLQVSCPHLLTPEYFAVVASCLFCLASCIWSQRLTLPALFDILPRLRRRTCLFLPAAKSRARGSAVAPAWLADSLRSAVFCGSCCVGAGGRSHNRRHRGDAPQDMLALMGFRYFDAPLFVLGAALVTAAAVALLFAAFSRVT